MKCIFTAVAFFISISILSAQAPQSLSSADIYQQLQKLPVLGNVLYIAAHPDDENTRLLSYLVNERHIRTGYLSITRGDGGQNLVGGELGTDLGLIRTQELLAARSIDGAEQFFTRAYDFGYSKSPEEALRIWGHDSILSDVVRIIREFKPDVIITRFPTTGEGGHGHHTASAILAGEAFTAAADPQRFREQLTGNEKLSTWKAKRLVWNTFNFGSNNTQRPDQLKIDVGMYNPILGKGYGEIAAESRSQHRSQGFGRSAERGKTFEYFSLINGEPMQHDILDGVDLSWKKMGLENFQKTIADIVQQYDFKNPAASLPALTSLYHALEQHTKQGLLQQKKDLLLKIIESTGGIFFQAYTHKSLVSVGDSLELFYEVLNRNGVDIQSVRLLIEGKSLAIGDLQKNEKLTGSHTVFIPEEAAVYQPYFLQQPKSEGRYYVENRSLIGKPENDPVTVTFQMEILGNTFSFTKPLQHKYTDPVRAEIYEPVYYTYPVVIAATPATVIFRNNHQSTTTLRFTLQANKTIHDRLNWSLNLPDQSLPILDTTVLLSEGAVLHSDINLSSLHFANNSRTHVRSIVSGKSFNSPQQTGVREIRYDHIPPQHYHYIPEIEVVKMDLNTSGSRAGYIAGAGDMIPEALQQMGYTVTVLNEENLTEANLQSLDVIITGVRAYNIHEWLSKKYDVLMQYVQKGGVLLVQYNTNNSIGPVKANMSPYPLNITRSRITDENATVRFLLPDSKLMNFPNKITDKDFEGWVQERSIYHATDPGGKYQKLFEMNDPGESSSDGALLVTDYGKGRFIYSGLVFFRELPAAVPGAYRLFANLIANNIQQK